MVSVLTRWCAAPINPTNTKEEIRSELESTRALAIIIMAGAAGTFDSRPYYHLTGRY